MAFGDKFRAEKRRKLFAKFRPGDNLIRQITSSGSSSGRGGGGTARREEAARKAAEEAKRKAEIARKARVAAQRREAKRLSDLLQQKKLADQKKLIGAIRKREKLKNALKGNKSLQSRPDLLGKAQIAVKKKRAELLRTNTLTGQRLGVALGFSSSLLGGVRKVKIKTDVPKKPPKRVKFEDFSKSNQKRLQNIADGKKPLTQRVSEAEIKFIEKRITQPSIKALERKGIKVPEILTKKIPVGNIVTDQLFLPGLSGSFAQSGGTIVRKAAVKEALKKSQTQFVAVSNKGVIKGAAKSNVLGNDVRAVFKLDPLKKGALKQATPKEIKLLSQGKSLTVTKPKARVTKFTKSKLITKAKQLKGTIKRAKVTKKLTVLKKAKNQVIVKLDSGARAELERIVKTRRFTGKPRFGKTKVLKGKPSKDSLVAIAKSNKNLVFIEAGIPKVPKSVLKNLRGLSKIRFKPTVKGVVKITKSDIISLRPRPKVKPTRLKATIIKPKTKGSKRTGTDNLIKLIRIPKTNLQPSNFVKSIRTSQGKMLPPKVRTKLISKIEKIRATKAAGAAQSAIRETVRRSLRAELKSIPKTGIKTIPGIKNGVSFKTSTNVKSSSGKTSTGKGKFKLETISGKVKDKIKFTDILKRTDKIIKEKTKTKTVQTFKTKLKTPTKLKQKLRTPTKTRMKVPPRPRTPRITTVPPALFAFLVKKKLIKKKKKKRIGKGGFALVEGFTAKALNLKPIKIKAKDIRKFAKRFQTVGIRRRPVIIKSKRSKKKR